MRVNFICFRFSKTVCIMICIIFIEIIYFGTEILRIEKEIKSNQTSSSIVKCESTENIILEKNIPCSSTSDVKIQTQESEKKPRILPAEFKKFEIIGKLEIPKLNLDMYILKECTSKALKVSVTKLCGPDINAIGNFCIAGHNYSLIFKDIKNLEKNDQIILTDVYGYRVVYQVYDIFQTSPKDVSCLSQNTGGDRELTLITCTIGAIKRVIVKAVEVYD